jgi:lysophospholipase L1-like esterase
VTIQLKRNDTKYNILYTLQHSTKDPVDLTGASVRFVMGKGNKLITNAPATILNASTGEVVYEVTEQDTLLPGAWQAEFEVTFADGKVKTYPNSGYIQVTIHPNIDHDKSTIVEDSIALKVALIDEFKEEVNAKVTTAEEAAAQVDYFQTQLDTMTIEGDSSVEAAQARVEADGTTNTTLKARLDKKDSQTNQKFDEVASQMAQTMKKGEVTVADIDKNKGKFDQTYMTEEFLQQMAGTTPINAIPADDSITLKKLTFYEAGKNLFDKNVATSGYYVNHLNGSLVASSAYYASDFIPVAPSTSYAINKSYWLAFYDANKSYISGVTTLSGAASTITTPANAIYMRVSIYNTLLDTLQVESGTASTPYESYNLKIPSDVLSLPDFDPNEIPDGSITKIKTDFLVIGKNKFDKSKAVDGYINQANGVLEVTSSYKASEFIPVLPNTNYAFTTGAAVRLAYYDSTKKFISGALNPVIPITTPSNAAFARFSFTPNQLDIQQFEQSTEQTEYQPFGYLIKDGIYREVKLSDQFEVEAVISPSIPALVGKELNIYFENIMNDAANKYQIDVVCSIGSQQTERWTVIPTTAGTYSMAINVFKNYALIKTISTSIVVKAASVGTSVNKKLLVIGDSTTANSIAIGELNNLFGSDVMDITLLGTKGTAPVLHEGISGWTVNHFYTDASSPFVFSGVFDFSQYMTTNGFSGTDYVVINLGINDTFSYSDDGSLNSKISTMLTQYQSIIDNIKAYNSSIKIGLAVTIPPNYSQDAFGKDYGSSQTRWRYKRNNYIWAKALINQFKGKEAQNIYLVPINVNIDTEHNFELQTVAVNSRNSTTVIRSATNSGVHPTNSGYYQIADLYYYWLKGFEV